jgi:hypothetical protein
MKRPINLLTNADIRRLPAVTPLHLIRIDPSGGVLCFLYPFFRDPKAGSPKGEASTR